MLLDGRWGLPRLIDGKLDLQKPPLYYWLVAGAGAARGGTVDAWAVRLPAALSALLGVLALYGFLACRGRPVAGFAAAACLATMGHYTWLARVGRIDMPLTLTVGVALGAFYLARNRTRSIERMGLQFIGYLAIAAAVMLKGPIGVVLPTVVLLARDLVERFLNRRAGGVSPLRLRDPQGAYAPRSPNANTPRSPNANAPRSPNANAPHSPNAFFRSSLWWGVPLTLALTVPWFWWANEQTGGEFFRVFLWKHNVERGFSSDDTGGMHARPWWLYVPYLAVDLLPWSLLLPFAIWHFMRKARWRADADARFGGVWLLGITALLSCLSFKRQDYLLPAYPGAALLIGCAVEDWVRAAARPRRLVGGLAVILVGCVAGWWGHVTFVLPQREALREQRTFAVAIRQVVPTPHPVMFFRTEEHALYFHLGRPIHTFLEWENLDVWAGRPGNHYIVMPLECARVWSEHVRSGQLEEVLRNTDLTGGRHERPLVLMRTVPHFRPGESPLQ
ncbi:MAG: glycosyltransferase family 39 protein [Gemmataceae bacterium]|nr:glycosyltransferase family 39 protein [Gemmataceae bacterium]